MDGDARPKWRSAGDLTPNIGNRQTGSASTPSSRPVTSDHGPPPSGSSMSIGMPLSRSTSSAVREMISAGADPEAVDKAVMSGLPRSIVASVNETPSIWTDDYGYHQDFGSITFAGGPAHDLAAATELVETAMTPISVPALREAMAYLRASTAGRNVGENEAALIVNVLAEECRSWPEDVVRAAIRGWARRERWFPTLSELREELHQHGRRRRALLDALKHPRPRPTTPAEQTKDARDLEDAESEAKVLAGLGYNFRPEEIVAAWRCWSGYRGCSWAVWGFSYRRGEPWAVALLRRLVELLETDPTPPAEVIRQVVEAGFAERG